MMDFARSYTVARSSQAFDLLDTNEEYAFAQYVASVGYR